MQSRRARNGFASGNAAKTNTWKAPDNSADIGTAPCADRVCCLNGPYSQCARAFPVLTESSEILYLFVFTHVFIPKPVPTFGRHALVV
ncbi:hypothetical protein F9L08_12200 [Brucella tritici]|uniref:Uncharacterized protein n=1 Tax=Brucella tritici TaxID=94626 RepID=A0A6L3YQU3_9HYPH|nr:hypothetical protein F9L08_12200 [Brucella tritici]